MLRPSGNKALISMRALVLPLGVLTMFAILIVTYVMTSGTSTATIPRLSCINPVILTGSFQDKTLPARAWVLVQAHVHQRHMDRWLYPHPLIGNLCWEDQLNSTHAPMPDQCTYDLSSVWEDFNHTVDPYAAPSYGSCAEKQLTKQGIANAEKFGRILKRYYMEKHQLVPSDCPSSALWLESSDEQKNQLTAQHEYLGMCGKLPSSEEYPAKKVLYKNKIQKGRPFWLSPSICGSPKLDAMMEESKKDMYQSTYWTEDVKDTTILVAHVTDQSNPRDEDRAVLLDNIVDCLVVHQCHNLTDFPPIFKNAEDLFKKTDTLETKSRTYPFDYFKYDEDKYNEFASLYFGYYYKVLNDRMEKKIKNSTDARGLYIQVTSDTVLTTQLKMMTNVGTHSDQRPPWGSSIIYELYKNRLHENTYAVRALFNGRTVHVCGNKGYCTWEEWTAKTTKFFPKKEDCAPFYTNYEN